MGADGAPKTVLEIHLIIRGALNDAVRRGIVTRNVALVAHAPKVRSIPKVEPQAWTAQELRAFLREAAGHRLFPALWLLANTGLRRSELLGLQWDDVDLDAATLSINRGLVSIGYELHESRGKTSNSRRAIDLDPTTVAVLSAWKRWQQAERAAVGIQSEDWVFADVDGNPIHPPLHFTDLRADHRPRRGPQGPSPRRPPYPRNPPHQSRCAGQGGE